VSKNVVMKCQCPHCFPAAPEPPRLESKGAAIDRTLRNHGYFTLTNLNGDRMYFYPRGGIPANVGAYLSVGDNLLFLRDFLITQARVGAV